MREGRKPDDRDIDARGLERSQLVGELGRGHGRARTDDAMRGASEHTARHDAKLVSLVADSDGVASISAPSKASDDLSACGEEIDDAPFAFIPPLRADDKGYSHARTPF